MSEMKREQATSLPHTWDSNRGHNPQSKRKLGTVDDSVGGENCGSSSNNNSGSSGGSGGSSGGGEERVFSAEKASSPVTNANAIFSIAALSSTSAAPTCSARKIRTGLTDDQPKMSSVTLYGQPIVSLCMDGVERLCLAQISNSLLHTFSYNEIHNRRVALGITCQQCTPVQLELLRRAGAMPVSSRRCGMITRREAERLCNSFLGDNAPPVLPDDFTFSVEHACAWGCRGLFFPARYNSSRAKCIKCCQCGTTLSPNKFIFHSHRSGDTGYVQPDAANFNSWRRHIALRGTPSDDMVHAWEDVKAMFNGGSRKRSATAHNVTARSGGDKRSATPPRRPQNQHPSEKPAKRARADVAAAAGGPALLLDLAGNSSGTVESNSLLADHTTAPAPHPTLRDPLRPGVAGYQCLSSVGRTWDGATVGASSSLADYFWPAAAAATSRNCWSELSSSVVGSRGGAAAAAAAGHLLSRRAPALQHLQLPSPSTASLFGGLVDYPSFYHHALAPALLAAPPPAVSTAAQFSSLLRSHIPDTLADNSTVFGGANIPLEGATYLSSFRQPWLDTSRSLLFGSSLSAGRRPLLIGDSAAEDSVTANEAEKMA